MREFGFRAVGWMGIEMGHEPNRMGDLEGHEFHVLKQRRI